MTTTDVTPAVPRSGVTARDPAFPGSAHSRGRSLPPLVPAAAPDITAVSLFAGIEGFGLALSRVGVHVTAAVEIDPDCRGVIARHFPGTALFEDVTEVTSEQLIAAGFVPGRGILAGGWPCQDLSVAGRRAGLGGARSGLFWHIVRLAGELRPQWLLLENVPGLLSAVCPCAGDDTCTGNGRAVRCGRWDKRDGRRVWLDHVQHAPPGGACRGGCMAVHGGAMGAVVGALEQLGYGLCWRVLDSQYLGVPQRRERVFFVGCLGDGAAPVQVLLEPESGERHLATRGATRPRAAGRAAEGTRGARTVGTIGGSGPGGGWRVGSDEAAAGQLITTLQGGGKRGHRVDAEGAAGGQLIPFDLAPPLAATLTSGSHGRGVNAPGRHDEDQFNLVAHALTSEGADASEDGTGRGIVTSGVPRPVPSSPVAFANQHRVEFSDVAQSVTGSHGQPGGVAAGLAVRRLTPKECERLQAFPDDWTRWKLVGGELIEQSDSARYRQVGNAVTTSAVQWIAKRIVAVSASREASADRTGAA